MGVYVALLWVYDLLSQLNDVAISANDEQGLTLVAAKRKPVPGRVGRSTVNSKASSSECFVYITLPGQVSAVTAGRFVLDKNARGDALGRSVMEFALSNLAGSDDVYAAVDSQQCNAKTACSTS